MDERIKRKLSKLYALSRKGVDGEKEMFERLLKQMLDKYGLKEQDFLCETEKKKFAVTFRTEEERRLINQCCACYFDTTSDEFKNAYWNSHKRYVVETNNANGKLFLGYARHHLNEYRRFRKLTINILLHSYFESHEIFPLTPTNSNGGNEMTEEAIKQNNKLISQLKCIVYDRKS